MTAVAAADPNDPDAVLISDEYATDQDPDVVVLAAPGDAEVSSSDADALLVEASMFTATPEPDTGSVLLAIQDLPAGPVTLTRTDANGTGPVRLLEGQEPISGALTVRDYEPALAGLVKYTVRDAQGTRTTVTTTMPTPAVPSPRLGLPVLPQYNVEVWNLRDYDDNREASHTVHHVVHRADPLVVMGLLRPRTGRLTFLQQDVAKANAIRGLYNRGEVALLRLWDAKGLDLYHVARSVSVRPEHHAAAGQRRWAVDVDYVEVAKPTSPLLGALGWGFDDVADIGTFDAVLERFPTFADVVAGL